MVDSLIIQSEQVVDQAFRVFGIKLFDEDFWELFSRFGFNFLVTFLIVRFLYYRRQQNRDYAFTFFVFNTVIFFVCFLLSSVKLSIGFAFGLFAVFSILRYRTTTIPIKEMTFLFTVITIGVINALATKKVSYTELFFTNFSIVLLIYLLDVLWYRGQPETRIVNYEVIENIKPENRDKLIADLKQRTGLEIEKVEILQTNFLRDTSRLLIYYHQQDKD